MAASNLPSQGVNTFYHQGKTRVILAPAWSNFNKPQKQTTDYGNP